jgi:hypothetical protein
MAAYGKRDEWAMPILSGSPGGGVCPEKPVATTPKKKANKEMVDFILWVITILLKGDVCRTPPGSTFAIDAIRPAMRHRNGKRNTNLAI